MSTESESVEGDPRVESTLRRELLRSETLRAWLFLTAVVVLLATVAVVWFGSGNAGASEEARARAARGCLALGALGVYEAGVLVWLIRRRGEGAPSPSWFPFVNTLVETGFATAIIVAIGAVSGLAQALAGAAPFVYFLLIGLSALYLDVRLSLFAGLVAAVQFGWLSSRALDGLAVPEGWEILGSPLASRIKAVILFLSGLVAAFVGARIRRQMRETIRSVAERDRAVSMFGQHVSPQVAELLLSQPIDYSGEQRRVCVMFLDIRDFSRLAGERSAPEVVDYLNRLFEPLIRIVNENGGIVNKFLGDGFMAAFGAPVGGEEPCRRAVEAARAMIAAVERLVGEGTIPATRIGIGLHVGDAVTGNVGSSERKEYTIIGDAVNLAARIEQATKQFGATLLVSEAVIQGLGTSLPEGAEDLGPVELKGQARPTRLFRLA